MSDNADPTPELTPAAAERQVDRGMSLLTDADLDGALAEFVAVEAATRFSTDPAARVQWGRSLNGLGFIELMDAKEARAAVGELDAAAEQAFRWGLKQALARFDQALAVLAEPTYRSFVTGNKAYALALLGRTEDAKKAFRAGFAEGGRGAYVGQIRDLEYFAIPEDRAVRRMLDEIWEDMGT